MVMVFLSFVCIFLHFCAIISFFCFSFSPFCSSRSRFLPGCVFPQEGGSEKVKVSHVFLARPVPLDAKPCAGNKRKKKEKGKKEKQHVIAGLGRFRCRDKVLVEPAWFLTRLAATWNQAMVSTANCPDHRRRHTLSNLVLCRHGRRRQLDVALRPGRQFGSR